MKKIWIPQATVIPMLLWALNPVNPYGYGSCKKRVQSTSGSIPLKKLSHQNNPFYHNLSDFDPSTQIK